MSKFKKGDGVIIKSLRCGGEIIDNIGDEGYVVRVAWLNPSSRSASILDTVIKESDLELLTKKIGFVIL